MPHKARSLPRASRIAIAQSGPAKSAASVRIASRTGRNNRASSLRQKNPRRPLHRAAPRKATHIGIRSRTGSGAKSANRRTNGKNRAIAAAVEEEGEEAAEEGVASAVRADASRAGVVVSEASGLAAENIAPRIPHMSPTARRDFVKNDPPIALAADPRASTAQRGEIGRRADVARKAGVANDRDPKARGAKGIRLSAGQSGRSVQNRRDPLRRPLTIWTISVSD